jgi:predicted nucleotidyltransferase
MMKVEKDFEDFIELLNKHKVEYMIVGAYALALYSKPRNTGDIDIFFNRTENNADLILNVLKEFGFESIGITREDLLHEGRLIQLGVSPVRIDILNSIDGVTFIEAYGRIEKVKFGSTVANFISREDLIKNKSSSSRKKDQADLEELL